MLSLIGTLLCLVPAPNPRGLDTGLTRLLQELPGLSGNRWEVSYDPLIPWLLAVLIATLWRADRKRVLRYMLVGLVSPLVFAALFAAEIGTDLWLACPRAPNWRVERLPVSSGCPPRARIATASPHRSRPLGHRAMDHRSGRHRRRRTHRLGIPETVATSTALTVRLITFYIPPV